MALLRRYSLYSAIAVFIIYMLYAFSFPYQPSDEFAYGHNPPPHRKPRPRPGQTYKPYDWEKIPIQNKIESYIPLPTGDAKVLPRIQFVSTKDEDTTARIIRESRREEVRKQFSKCWGYYRRYAWMHDEIRPIDGEVNDHFGGWAATLIDALDTLLIMGFEEEFNSAVADIEQIDFGYTDLDSVNVFETNIRHLGGLISAYELSRDERLLYKAQEVGEMLYHAFDTPNHMPITRWNFRAAGEGKPQVADEQVLLAEIGSMAMEFTRLSQLTGDPRFYDAVARITKALEKQQDSSKLPGMWPIVVNARNADFTKDGSFTLNSMSDSVFEYLPKMYALLGGLDPAYRTMYEKAMSVASKFALFRPMLPDEADILVSGHVHVEGSTTFTFPEMQHLGCYTGGMFGLGGKLFQNKEHLRTGRKLADGCVWAYKASQSGIMPEVSHMLKCADKANCTWNETAWQDAVVTEADNVAEKDPVRNIANLRLPRGFTAVNDRRYILRPEAIESVFLMYRMTGEQAWQAAAWDMWTAIQRATDTDLGNSALADVNVESPPRIDSMESFWMAETLKYFFLTFSEPDVMSLDEWVFNTEAHAFRIPKSADRQRWGPEEEDDES